MNENQNLENTETTDTSTDYIEAIEKLKKETVSKDAFEKLREENKKLLNNIVNNTPVDPEVLPKKVDLGELRKKMFSGTLNNLEYCETVLELRNAIIESGKPDPFLPIGKNIAPDDSDVADAEKVAELLKDCVEYAEGDSTIFTDALQRRMVDLPRPRKK